MLTLKTLTKKSMKPKSKSIQSPKHLKFLISAKLVQQNQKNQILMLVLILLTDINHSTISQTTTTLNSL